MYNPYAYLLGHMRLATSRGEVLRQRGQPTKLQWHDRTASRLLVHLPQIRRSQTMQDGKGTRLGGDDMGDDDAFAEAWEDFELRQALV